MRVIVVGGGIMGLCTAWALQRAGHEPVLFEQGPLPNPLASSTDQHRLIRFTYGAMTGYARMVHDAHGAWRRLFVDLGQSHYRPTGTLVVAREDDGWVADSARCLQELGVALERWSGAELARHLPFLDLEGARYALFTPSGGVLFAERILRALAGWLRFRGVALDEHAPVAEVDPAHALIRTEGGREHRADALVIAAGPWAPLLLPALAGRVVPSRQVALYLEPPAERIVAWQAAPMVLDQIAATAGGFYAVPPVDGTALKVGDHGFSLRGHPDREREPTPGEVAAICALAATRLRDFERYRVSAARTCFYSVAAQERFIVERCERAWILAGFSGHGFKFGALIGERVAAAIDEKLDPATLTAWAAGRT